MLVRAAVRTHGLDASITRCSNNYGPYQHIEKVVPLFITNILRGRNVPLYGDGANVREWLHVDDHCRAVRTVLDKGRPGEIYNIGGGVELSNRELTDRLLHLLGADWSRVRHVADRKGHDLRYAIDCTKIHDELGFSPSVDFGTGLDQVVAWYRDNRTWWDIREGETADAR
jgi:dTDP-glucose 4,6-dehydratase